jgi:hypothetical protein
MVGARRFVGRAGGQIAVGDGRLNLPARFMAT